MAQQISFIIRILCILILYFYRAIYIRQLVPYPQTKTKKAVSMKSSKNIQISPNGPPVFPALIKRETCLVQLLRDTRQVEMHLASASESLQPGVKSG